jgi:hypothetical protein
MYNADVQYKLPDEDDFHDVSPAFKILAQNQRSALPGHG